MFWRKTISGNDFTTHRVFGCAWKIEFSKNQFHLIVNIMPLTWKMVYIFIFTSNYFQRCAKREREREREYPTLVSSRRQDCTTTEIAPQHRRHHLDRYHPKPISSAPTLPISFLFSTQSSSPPPILSSRSRRP